MKTMKSKILTFIVVIGLSAFFSNIVLAQEVTQDIRTTLFAKVDKVLQQANEKNAILLSPENYKNGMKLYQEADRLLKQGDNLQDIKRKIDEAGNYFEKANEATKIAEFTFESAISARNNAIKVNAVKFAPNEWRDAEEEFADATKKLEEGDSRKAKERGDKAESLYRNAELLAIQTNILTPSRSLLKGIDRKNQAPLTYSLANQLVEESENMLKNNRYETDKATGSGFAGRI